MCARPISSSRALLRLCTGEPTHCKRFAAGTLNFQSAIVPLQTHHFRISAYKQNLCRFGNFAEKLALVLYFQPVGLKVGTFKWKS